MARRPAGRARGAAEPRRAPRRAPHAPDHLRRRVRRRVRGLLLAERPGARHRQPAARVDAEPRRQEAPKDPLEQPATFADRSGAARSSRRRRSRERVDGARWPRREPGRRGEQAALAGAAAADEAAAAAQRRGRAVPENRGRQPVTLGVDRAVHRRRSRSPAYAALLLSLPFLLWQLYAFVLPAFSRASGASRCR